MRVAIFDADLIGRSKHRFPNLVCEKLSGYWKEKGANVELITRFPDRSEWLGWENKYDETYISKVFTNTPVPEHIVPSEHVHLGGTGFYFDKAPNLPDEIEHHMPDYNLYNEWIEGTVNVARSEAEAAGKPFNEAKYRAQFKEYTDCSIGFLTRGCFRKCSFCVNQKYDHVFPHSPLEEFYDPSRRCLCFLDDNFLGCPQWRELLAQVLATGKRFKFKQGLDERLLTDEKAEVLFNANYDGDYIFAFDNIADYELIHKKLTIIDRHNKKKKNVKFYVLVGFEGTDVKDIENAFKRIELLFHYHCFPYIMRYMGKDDAPWEHSKYRHLYVTLARWCNQPSIVKKMTFREFCCADQATRKGQCSSMRSMLDFESEYPDIAKQYYDSRFGEANPKFLN